MKDCKPLAIPMALNQKLSRKDGKEKVDKIIYQSLVNSLIYLTNTRPNIVHRVNIIFKFMSEPSKPHFIAAKRILRYVKGTKSFGILYKFESDNNLIGYTNGDWANNVNDRKSTSGYMLLLRSKVIS